MMKKKKYYSLIDIMNLAPLLDKLKISAHNNEDKDYEWSSKS